MSVTGHLELVGRSRQVDWVDEVVHSGGMALEVA